MDLNAPAHVYLTFKTSEQMTQYETTMREAAGLTFWFYKTNKPSISLQGCDQFLLIRNFIQEITVRALEPGPQ